MEERSLEDKIGFTKVKEQLAEKCQSSIGRQMAEALTFSNQPEQIQRDQYQVREFFKLLSQGMEYPYGEIPELGDSLSKLRVEGLFLSEEELHRLQKLLSLGHRFHQFFNKHQSLYPELFALNKHFSPQPQLERELDKILDEEGHLKPNASPELARISKSLRDAQANLRKNLDRIIRSGKAQRYLPEGAGITIRGGRMVIPVLAEHKRHIKGFVHDESATGQTVYMEPTEVLEVNNQIRGLEAEKSREIVRILLAMTDKLRPEAARLQDLPMYMGRIDFIRAKALLGRSWRCTSPDFSSNDQWIIVNGRHPLLWMAHQAQGKEVVPLQLSLDQDARVLVISGPNAGGKSVALKTASLLQYMFQSGLMLTVGEGSKFRIFNRILVDIGDEQSIENDLSTYSSHLSNMKRFAVLLNQDSFFCIDEFGTGTEPQFGGAIAEALLHYFHQSGAYGIVTTHYSNLKELAHRSSGMVNGSMQYDVDRLEPLFSLKIGQPGSSFALEIAEKIGLPKEVILKARDLAGASHVQLEEILALAQKEKIELERENAALKANSIRLKSSIGEYEKLSRFLEEEKKKIINEAKLQARQLLDQSNREIENTIRKIKENKADKAETQKVRQDLERFKEKIKPSSHKSKGKDSLEKVEGPIEQGSWVRIKGTDTQGQVLELSGKKAIVAMGSLRSTQNMDRLEKISRRELRKQEVEPRSSKSLNLNEKMVSFKPEVDVRGKRGEEVLGLLDSWVDDAILLGQRQVRIIHGKGNGILQSLIRNHFQKHSQIQEIREEHPDFGGSGVTFLVFK